MGKKIKTMLVGIVIGLSVLILVGAGFMLGWQRGLPIHLAKHYSLDSLREEALLMNECSECHDGADFHRCSTCHDEHGATEFADLPFFNLISFSGDVPQPGFVELNQILPYRDQPNTHITLLDFLAEQGVGDFESVTLTSRDGGFITISRENLTDQALLLPFTDGIRFAAEDLHVSTWLKGITGMIVVGNERDLTINGAKTSLGRLLLGPTRQVVTENARVMFNYEIDGQTREAQTASRVWGAAVADLYPDSFSQLVVKTRDGALFELTPLEAGSAVLIAERKGPTLVLPERSKSSWISPILELIWE